MGMMHNHSIMIMLLYYPDNSIFLVVSLFYMLLNGVVCEEGIKHDIQYLAPCQQPTEAHVIILLVDMVVDIEL